MDNDTKQTEDNHITKWIASLLGFLREHPIKGFFLLTFVLTWLWEIPIFGFMDYWPGYVFFRLFISPSVIGLIMVSITEGNQGINHLLGKCAHWRVSIIWYLVALLVTPILFFISVFSIPGTNSAFQLPGLSFIWTYSSALYFGFFSAPIIEELGWRGFALPRLEKKYGPLVGTLILGFLWALWHLPSWFLGGRAVSDSNFIENIVPFLKYEGSILGSAIFYTWIFNRTNGSIFLSMLLHASINVTFSEFPNAFFPSLYPPDAYTRLFSQIGFIPFAILVIIFTKGRLGYDYYSQTNRA
jgi:membrane protease YdiL (CAAX protease family)